MLSCIAKIVLTLPVTVTPSERFSILAGVVRAKRRAHLGTHMTETFVKVGSFIRTKWEM